MADTNVRVIFEAIDKLTAPLRSMGGQLTAFAGKADDVASSMTKAGTGMVAIGAAPAAAMAFATKAAIDFENSFAGVRKTVDLSEKEFKQLSQNFRDISKVTPLAVNDLNAIGEIAGSLGISGVDNITKFTETIAKIGITSNLTEEEAAMAFGRIANIMQEPIENVDRMGATIIDLGNKLAATERDITNFAERISGAGKIAGLTTRDVFAIGAAMASVGVEAEAGGTAVQKVLIDMNTAVATSNDSLAVFAKTAGMTSAEFQKRWKTDAAGAFEAFVSGLGKSGDQATTILDNLGLADARLIRAFLSLGNAGDLLKQSLDVSNEAWKSNTALSAEAEKRYATTASQIQIFKNNLYDLGIVIGDVILPRINAFIDKMIPLVQGFAKFASEHPKLTTGLLGIGAAIGAVGAGLMVLAPIISSLTVIIPLLKTGVLKLGTAIMTKMIPAITGMIVAMGPIGWILIAITAAVALFALAWKNNWGDIQGKTKAVLEWIGNKIEQVKDFFSDFGSKAGEAFEKILPYLKTFGLLLLGPIGWIILLKQAWDNNLGGIRDKVAEIGEAIATTFENIKNAIFTKIGEAIEFIKGIPSAISNAITAGGQALYTFFTSTLPYAIGFAVGRIERFFTVDIPAFLMSVYNAFVNFATVTVPEAWNMLVTFFTETVPAFMLQLWTWFVAGLTLTWQAVVNFATVQVPQAISAMITWLTTEVPALMNRIVNWFVDMGKRAWNAIVEFKNNAIKTFTEAKDNAIQITTEFINGVVEWFSSLPGKINSFLSALPGIVSKWFNDAKEKAINIAKELYNGVKEWFDKVIKFFGDIIDKAGQAINKAKEAFGAGREAGLSKQTGGIVPGPIGAAVPITAHAGEEVIPQGLSSSGSGGGGLTINLSIGMYAGTETEKRNIARNLYAALLQVAQSQNKNVAEYMGG